MSALDQVRRHAQAGQAYLDRQDWATARAEYAAALRLLNAGPVNTDRVWREAVADLNAKRGQVELGAGQPDLARDHYEAALRDYSAIGMHDGPYVSAALSSLGLAYRGIGDPDRAVTVLRQAVDLKRRHREGTASLGGGLNNLALALQAAGDLDGADEALAEALRLPKLSPDLASRFHQERAFILMNRGDFAAALVLLGRRLEEIGALERAGRLPAPSLERAICAGNLGGCYSALQNKVEARRYYRDAVAARRIRTPDSVILATALSNLAMELDDQGERAEKQRLLDEAVRLAERHAPHSPMLAIARGHLALLLIELGRPRDAVELALRAIDESPAANRELSNARLAAASAYLELGHAAAAEVLVRQAYAACTAVSTQLADLRPILTMLGRLAHRRGDLDAAARHYDEAIAVAERFRAGAAREPGLELAFGQARDAYHGRIEVSYERKRPGDARAAFQAAEAFRARTLAELLSTGDRPAPVTVDAIQHRLGAIYQLLETPMGADRIAQLRAERDDLEQRAERERLRLLAQQPEAADRRFPVPCTVDKLQTRLDAETTLALYEVTEEHAYLWKVTRDTFTFRRLRPSAAELADAVGEVLSACRAGNAGAPPSAALERLGGWLAGSLESATGRLIICADTTLAYLPFEALPGLPASCVVSYAPSATTLVRFGDRPAPRPSRDFAGFAVEHTPGLRDLPDAVDEVRDAAAHFGGKTVCRSGRDVTVKAVRKYAAGSRFVHFAAHGVILDERPLHSGIPLPDGFLPAYEMFSLDLCAELVVLSACESGVGTAHAGEGVVGLSRALFAAGARAVLLTRWNVRSLAALSVMDEFYPRLAGGLPPARALAEAIRAVRADKPGEFAHPREWAAFMLLDTHLTRLR